MYEEKKYRVSVDYLKDLEEFNIKPEKTGKSIYHASEEELQGQAYIEFDRDTGISTIFRDTPGKYQDQQYIGNKKYCILDNINNSINVCSDTSGNVKKIIIKDPIKITHSYFFSWMENLTEIDGIEKVDTSDLEYFTRMFTNDKSLKKLDLSTWDTSNVTNMEELFYYLGMEASEIDISGINDWNVSNVATMEYMFNNSFNFFKDFELDLSSWNISSLNNNNYMFNNFGQNTTGDKGFKLNISGWNTDNITNKDGFIYNTGNGSSHVNNITS